MLVLSRKTTESIQIGDNIEVRVLEISGGRVRLGISATVEIPVHRSEVATRIDQEIEAPDGGPARGLVYATTSQMAATLPAGDQRLRRRAR
jgi:carbon storage regulator